MKRQTLIQNAHELERGNHIDLDAVLHKVTQELGEVLEARQENDMDHIVEEIGDVLFNVLSAHTRIFGGELSEKLIDDLSEDLSYDSTQLMILLSKRNDAIQKHRGIYSKSTIDPQKVHTLTSKLLGGLVSLAKTINPDASLEKMFEDTLNKFAGREGLYLPKVDIKSHIRDVPDFPKKGIIFKDISPILAHSEAFNFVIDSLIAQTHDADVIVGLDARGFIFATGVAMKTQKPLVMARKPGKLPGEIISQEYDLEYGTNELSIQSGIIKAGQKVAIIDDILATGGTMEAAVKLIEKAGGEVHSCNFVIELAALNGKQKIQNYPIRSAASYA